MISVCNVCMLRECYVFILVFVAEKPLKNIKDLCILKLLALVYNPIIWVTIIAGILTCLSHYPWIQWVPGVLQKSGNSFIMWRTNCINWMNNLTANGSNFRILAGPVLSEFCCKLKWNSLCNRLAIDAWFCQFGLTQYSCTYFEW